MKKLFIFTDSYPTEIGEWPFLAPELEKLRNFFNIKIICCNTNSKINEYVPDYISVIFFRIEKESLILTIIALFKSFFSKIFLCELIKLIRINRINNIKYMMRYWIKALRLSKFLKRNKIIDNNSLIYTYWNNYATLGGIIHKIHSQNNIKIISRIHRYDLYLTSRNNFYQPFKFFMNMHLDKLFFISQEGKDYFIDKYAKIDSNKYIVSRLGVNDNGFLEFSPEESLKIISCSYLSPVKRINKIIDSIALIDFCKIEWHHIGDGNLFDEIWEYANFKLNSNKNITFKFLGRLSNEEVILNYKNNNYDIFVNTSESEGIPLSMMEAQSFGIPIIGTNVGGVSEIVNSETGWLIDRDFDYLEFRDIVWQYKQLNKIQIFNLRQNCRLHWEKHFNAERNHKNFLMHIMSMFEFEEVNKNGQK